MDEIRTGCDFKTTRRVNAKPDRLNDELEDDQSGCLEIHTKKESELKVVEQQAKKHTNNDKQVGVLQSNDVELGTVKDAAHEEMKKTQDRG